MEDEPPHPLLLPKSCYRAWYRWILRPILLLVFPLLLIFRALIALPLIGLSAFIDCLCNICTDPAKPLPVWRYKIFYLNKLVLYRLALFSLGWVVIYRGKVRKDVQAVLSNHCSMLDILALTSCGIQSCIAKSGIADNPFFGPTIRVTRSILARKGGAAGLIYKRFESSDWPPLGVFPQGTTTYEKRYIKLRSGVFLHKPSIQLVSVSYKSLENPYYVVPAKHHLIGCVCGLLGFIIVRFDYQKYEADDMTAEEYKDFIEGKMVARSDGVQTGYAYNDVMWFVGNHSDFDSVSEAYKQQQAWRGTRSHWMSLCKKMGKNPLYQWSKRDLGIYQ